MIHYLYIPIIFWPIYSSQQDTPHVYVRYEPTLVYGLTRNSPYTFITDDSDELDYQPYTHHFFPEDGSEDSCCDSTNEVE